MFRCDTCWNLGGGRYPVVNLHVAEPNDLAQQESAVVHGRSLRHQIAELEDRVRFERDYLSTMMGSVLSEIQEMTNATRGLLS